MVTPWYKQFWPWFLIALPASVVVASLLTVTVFSMNSVSLVAEDYYKKGKAINVDLSKLKVAAQLGVSAQLSSNNQAIAIALDKGDLASFPALNVHIQHRTLERKDVNVMVNPNQAGIYHIDLAEPISGPWFIEITSFDKQWKVHGRINFPVSTPLTLTGKQ
ncbi:nitrogen fixation protein FixH [Salinivibrio sp. ML198]|uniref:FixH family protein n=1 Tax=Salinivibrio sp. ML198 TaxID=1909458 RepID=UPI00098992B1|nr:FixH family protein [Salinivibrio sp. ML198]OOE82013.1 nitrogen fixation protein FixH [Salinivibrio sp. ML198]